MIKFLMILDDVENLNMRIYHGRNANSTKTSFLLGGARGKTMRMS